MDITVDNDALIRAIYRWEEQAPVKLLLDRTAYKKHFLDEYGISVSLLGNDVVDEQKYMLFVLRWS